MDRQKITIIVAAFAGLLAIMLWLNPFGDKSNNHGDNNANFPEGTWWIGGDAGNPHEFHLTIQELSDHHLAHYGEPVPCPKTGKPATRADKCPHCGKLSPQQRDPGNCPHCGQPMVPAGP